MPDSRDVRRIRARAGDLAGRITGLPSVFRKRLGLGGRFSTATMPRILSAGRRSGSNEVSVMSQEPGSLLESDGLDEVLEGSGPPLGGVVPEGSGPPAED